MRNLLLLFLLVVCFEQTSFAQLAKASQNQKVPIAIFPFVAATSEFRARAAQIQQIVSEVLRKKSNIELIDRSNDSLLIKELDFQIREQSVEASGLVNQGKILGARQLIAGTVSNANVEVKTESGYDIFTKRPTVTTNYVASISFALQLIDVETGKIVSQKSFGNNESGGGKLLGILNVSTGVGRGSSRENAISEAISSTRRPVSLWINETYPPEIKILKIDGRDKKGYPETILVSGIDATLQKGSQVIINEIEMVDAGDGKSLKRTKKMAELKVKEIQGEITICRVTDGEKLLEDKMNSGTKMEFVVK